MKTTKKLSTESRDFRECVILYLLLITSDESLRALHPFQPSEKVAYEMASIWFDEIYLPGEKYFQGGLKGDLSDESILRFREFFSDKELRSMARFHRFFELRLEMLPRSARLKQVFPQNDSWHHIIKDATYLVEEIVPDAKMRREELTRLVKETIRGNGSKIRALNLIHPGKGEDVR